MGLLRRNPRPAPPPGDWMDALQAAMRVNPALRPKREPPPPPRDFMPDEADDVAPRPAAEIPRRFHQPERPRSSPGPDTATPPVEKPWLVPIPAPVAPAAAPAGAAPEAVEQLFQWVCRLSRVRRTDAGDDAFAADALRRSAERHLSAIAAAGPLGLRLRGPLASFVDVIMMRAGLPVSGPWRPLGPVPPERAYGLAVAEAAADPTGLHDGSWVVHHAALSLVADLLPAAADFPGGLAVLDQLDLRLHGVAAATADDRICPGAYEGVFDHAIVRPVGRPIRALAAAAVGLLLLAVAGAVLLNLRYVGQLRGSVDAVDRALTAHPKTVQEKPQAGV